MVSSEGDEEPMNRSRKIPWGIIMFVAALAVLLGLLAFIFRFPDELLGLGKNNRNNSSGTGINETSEDASGDSSYNVVVPNFIGRYREKVEGNETYRQFKLVFEEENNSSYPEGMIFEQSIKDKTPVEEGTEILLKVSTGPEKIPMPQCVGLTIEAARALLDEQGIVDQEVPNYRREEV